MKTKKKQPVKNPWPTVTARGFRICRDDHYSPPGITNEELLRVLSDEEYCELRKWARGCTCASNGLYPWDLEEFLCGRPNLD